MAASESVVLKISCGDQLRRTQLTRKPLSMAELNELISCLFPNVKNFTLQYVDEEGDKITVTTDLELQEAHHVCSPTLRLIMENCSFSSLPPPTGSLLHFDPSAEHPLDEHLSLVDLQKKLQLIKKESEALELVALLEKIEKEREREDREQREKEERERREREERERIERIAQEERERREKEENARKEAEQIFREERERREKEERERREKEENAYREAERRVQEECERREKEERERREKEEIDRKEAERILREDCQRRDFEQRERLEKEEKDHKEAERIVKEEEDLQRMLKEKLAKEQEALRQHQQQSHLEQNRQKMLQTKPQCGVILELLLSEGFDLELVWQALERSNYSNEKRVRALLSMNKLGLDFQRSNDALVKFKDDIDAAVDYLME